MNFWSSISKLPKSCSLCGSLSGVKSSNVFVSSVARALTSSGRALTAAVIVTRPPVNDLRSLRVLDFSALGALDRLVHHRWDTGRCIGSPIHPTNLYRRDRCGVSETTASASSSFRSLREGMGNFGIAFLRGGERFGKLGR